MIVYEQVGQSYMRFNNKQGASKSGLISAQEQLMAKYIFDT